MADGNIMGIFTQKVGPLPGWGWAGIVGVGALALMSLKGKKAGATPASGSAANVTGGQYASNQSQETTDPVTGKRTTSSYQASGPTNGGWGGGVGLPMGYPMPYSGGDVFVNLPGDQQNLNAGRPVRYPPKVAPGTSPGHVGGYWWTPLTTADEHYLGAAAYGVDASHGMSPDLAYSMATNYTRIVDANPQIDWANISSVGDLLGHAIYVPRGATGDNSTGVMPANSSVNAPRDYTPPVQQTTVSSG